jgi:hypothetical protein
MREKTGDYGGIFTNFPSFPLIGNRPYFEFAYHKKKADGSFQKKAERVVVVLNHCPFCGKTYDTNQQKNMKTTNFSPTIYRAGGSQEPAAPANKKDFTLKELQAIVGGYIEMVFLNNGQIMVVNEEGKLEGLPLNVRATEIIRRNGKEDTIVGDVLVCPSKMIK